MNDGLKKRSHSPGVCGKTGPDGYEEPHSHDRGIPTPGKDRFSIMGDRIPPIREKCHIRARIVPGFPVSGSPQPACFSRFLGELFEKVLHGPGLPAGPVFAENNRPV
jgi:hypothetical protein